MAYIMVISIGPVQGFIASARRTSDFAYGSWLLSELAKAIALKLHTGGHTLIFPHANPAELAPATQLNVPNKLIAQINTNDQDKVAALARELEAALQARLKELVHELEAALKARLEKLYGDTVKTIRGIDQQTAWAQIADLPQFYWAAAPLEAAANAASYANARSRAEALLAARKNTRAFAPVTWGKAVYKSSLTGELESVLTSEIDAEHRWQTFRAGPHEHLSGVDLLKRLGGVGRSFPSTSHMAAKPFMIRFTNPVHAAVQQAWNAYHGQIIKFPEHMRETAPLQHRIPFFDEVDGAVLFEERLAEAEGVAGIADAKKALRDFLDEAAKHGYGRPQPYYAILLGDGDGMGKVIDELSQLGGLAAHQELSKALDRFVAEARELITEHGGEPIYIGGDDVLALLPLHTVLECADVVAEKFAATLAPVVKHYALPFQPSLSAGVAIVHHLVPLTDAVDLARAAEKAAKSVDGKDALAITISRRSGGDYTIKGKRAELVGRLGPFVQLFANDLLPHGVAYEIRDLVLRLGLDPEAGVDDDLLTAARQDVIRMFKRKQPQGKGIEPTIVQDISTQLGLSGNGQAALGLMELAHELVIAKSLADASRVSLQKAKKEHGDA
ncbi:MAG: type III-B CRISPR-associated protein Cas10/Cmr2 [Chloroflexaceae bacterium]|nr:type III-B CRISPR-associated protein Cas10/Cmr2 [Chloroflexaceae bacterium]